MSWTDERVERLKKLWASGESASGIATKLGGVTRNAVISKVHRMGMSGRGGAGQMSQHRSWARHKAKGTFIKPAGPKSAFMRALYAPEAEPFIPAGPDIEIPLAERKLLADLESRDCRWPIGDPQHADFHFCGKSRVQGLPYCEFHARRAYQPPSGNRPQIRAAATATKAKDEVPA